MTWVLTFCTACGPAVSTLCSGDKEKEMQNMHVQPKFLILTNRSRPACNWNKAGVLPKHCCAVLEGKEERFPLLFQKIMALIITFLFLALPIRCQVLETVKVIFIFCKSSQRLLQWGNFDFRSSWHCTTLTCCLWVNQSCVSSQKYPDLFCHFIFFIWYLSLFITTASSF